ncbi:SiaB family protein kinase [Aphanothece microscopica]|uniref:SiaB family protein kinase n=1 Tax=Aphanothece microscopica TaxID=1049561 RepID=UPI003985202C
MRDFLFAERILICFNGPAARGLICELGEALRTHLSSSQDRAPIAMDVFGVYIEMSQNIQHYANARGYEAADAAATVVIAESAEGHVVVIAGNVVEAGDGQSLLERVNLLARLPPNELKALYKQQLRQPRQEGSSHGAGLGLLTIARKSSIPLQCRLDPLEDGKAFFTLCSTIG